MDVIAEITSYSQYAAFRDQLRGLGFSEDTREKAPTCRLIHNELTLDVMPLDSQVLGFTNRWYRAAMNSATWQPLSNDLSIRVITAPLFIATKLEAFKGRGDGHLLASHDLEDIISLVDGRPTIVAEMREQPSEIKAYVRSELSDLRRRPSFLTRFQVICFLTR